MTETLFISKKEKSVYSKDELIKLFKSNSDLDNIKSYVEKAEDRIFVAWSTVDAVDKSGERIPVEDIIKDMENYMQMPAINDEHTNGVVGKCLSYKVMIHPETKSLGILQLNEILKRNKRDDQVWTDLQSGKKTGLSVGGIVGSDPHYESKTDGSFVKVLTGFQQYETSVVENPCNQHALNEAVSAVAKSTNTESFESREKKMVEETKTETVVEETTKQDESNMEDEQSKEISVEDVVQMVQAVMGRLDELEAAISGKPEEDGEEKADDEEDTDSEDEEDDKEDKSTSTEISKLESKVEELTKSYDELKKKFEVKEVIKSERPTQEVKKKDFTALDVARGKAMYQNGMIVERVK